MISDDKPAGPAQQDASNADPTHLEAESPLPVTPVQLPGEFLVARRKQMKLSIGEVSARVRLASRQIVALEENDFGALPGMATVRGFIRSYAKLLGLDPEPLVAMLKHEPNPAFEPMVVRRPLPASRFNSRRYAPSMLHRPGARRLAGFAAVVLVFVGTLAFIAHRSGWLSLPALNLASTEAAPQIVATIATPAPLPLPDAAVGLPADALQLKAREDSWVEVVAINGERKLLSKLMKAGTTELVEVSEPVVLVVGNVAGMDAVLRGEVLNLKAAARDNLVKLSLDKERR